MLKRSQDIKETQSFNFYWNTYRRYSKRINSRTKMKPNLVAIPDGGSSYARPAWNGGILSLPQGRFLFFARFPHFKRVECDPSLDVQGCTPLTPERKNPSLETMLKLCSRFFLSTLSFSFICLSSSFFLCTLQSLSSTLLAAVPVISSLARARGLHLAPGTGASALTFCMIWVLPVSLLRGFIPKIITGQ